MCTIKLLHPSMGLLGLTRFLYRQSSVIFSLHYVLFNCVVDVRILVWKWIYAASENVLLSIRNFIYLATLSMLGQHKVYGFNFLILHYKLWISLTKIFRGKQSFFLKHWRKLVKTMIQNQRLFTSYTHTLADFLWKSGHVKVVKRGGSKQL